MNPEAGGPRDEASAVCWSDTLFGDTIIPAALIQLQEDDDEGTTIQLKHTSLSASSSVVSERKAAGEVQWRW
jgi:hypothetical protein